MRKVGETVGRVGWRVKNPRGADGKRLDENVVKTEKVEKANEDGVEDPLKQMLGLGNSSAEQANTASL